MTAIITGSDSGIGRATAVALAQAGHDIGITWRSDEAGAQATAREVREAGRGAAIRPLDLTGAFVAAQAAARLMVDAGAKGRIVNVTSVHEHVPIEGATPYVAAKHGLGGLTKMLALELAPHGITVNSVAPGEIATPMTGQTDEDPRRAARPGIPAGRPGDAREIAATIAFLASPEAAYVTGASYVVDGGMLLMAAQANPLASS